MGRGGGQSNPVLKVHHALCAAHTKEDKQAVASRKNTPVIKAERGWQGHVHCKIEKGHIAEPRPQRSLLSRTAPAITLVGPSMAGTGLFAWLARRRKAQVRSAERKRRQAHRAPRLAAPARQGIVPPRRAPGLPHTGW